MKLTFGFAVPGSPDSNPTSSKFCRQGGGRRSDDWVREGLFKNKKVASNLINYDVFPRPFFVPDVEKHSVER